MKWGWAGPQPECKTTQEDGENKRLDPQVRQSLWSGSVGGLVVKAFDC